VSAAALGNVNLARLSLARSIPPRLAVKVLQGVHPVAGLGWVPGARLLAGAGRPDGDFRGQPKGDILQLWRTCTSSVSLVVSALALSGCSGGTPRRLPPLPSPTSRRGSCPGDAAEGAGQGSSRPRDGCSQARCRRINQL